MIDANMIEEVKKRLIKAYNPSEIYIFGSYAWGSPDEESDLDLCVVVDELGKDRYRALVEGHKALMDLDLAKDIILCTQQEFNERVNNVSTMIYKIKRRGKQIYARA